MNLRFRTVTEKQ